MSSAPTLPSLYLRRSFSNLFVTSPTSQLILQPFCRFTYFTAHSPTLPLLHQRHSSFSNPSFASPTSQALHLRNLASRPWCNSFTSFLILYTKRAILSEVAPRDSHSGGLGFKSQCRQARLRFFRGFPQSPRQMLGWIFITTTIHLTIIHQIHIS